MQHFSLTEEEKLEQFCRELGHILRQLKERDSPSNQVSPSLASQVIATPTRKGKRHSKKENKK